MRILQKYNMDNKNLQIIKKLYDKKSINIKMKEPPI